MENRIINLKVVAQVAEGLQELKDQVVFVGGAVVSLYTDDPAADEIRPTGDVDMTVHVSGYKNWTVLQERLGQLGFHPDPNGHAICSYLYKDIPVDFMSPEDGPMGPANRWYKYGFEDVRTTTAEGIEIRIFSAPCYLATKFEAFHGREPKESYRTSHDVEDIVYVIDNRMGIVDEVANDHPEIRSFLQEQLQALKSSGQLEEVLMAHIHPLVIEERQPIVMEKIDKIIAL